MNNYLEQFIENSKGYWESFRTYHYVKDNIIENIQSDLTISLIADNTLNIKWESYNSKDHLKCISKGSMDLIFDAVNNTIERSRGYFTKNHTKSKIITLTDSILETLTEYNNQKFIERIDYYQENPLFRRRFTKAYNSDSELYMIGNYLEIKK